jgi:hypothetical protein
LTPSRGLIGLGSCPRRNGVSQGRSVARTIPGMEMGSAETVPVTVQSPKYRYKHVAADRFGRNFLPRINKKLPAGPASLQRQRAAYPRHCDATQDKKAVAAQWKWQRLLLPRGRSPPAALLDLHLGQDPSPSSMSGPMKAPPSSAGGHFWRRRRPLQRQRQLRTACLEQRRNFDRSEKRKEKSCNQTHSVAWMLQPSNPFPSCVSTRSTAAHLAGRAPWTGGISRLFGCACLSCFCCVCAVLCSASCLAKHTHLDVHRSVNLVTCGGPIACKRHRSS